MYKASTLLEECIKSFPSQRDCWRLGKGRCTYLSSDLNSPQTFQLLRG